MIALEHERTGFVDAVVEFAAGSTVQFKTVVNLHAVEDHGGLVADQGDLGVLPFARRARNELSRRGKVVEGAITAPCGLAGGVVVDDLQFVSAAQIKPAVRPFRDQVIEADDEVPEPRFADQIGAVFVRTDGVDQHAVLGAPTGQTAGVAQSPPGQVRAVEQRPESLEDLERIQFVALAERFALAFQQAQRPEDAPEVMRLDVRTLHHVNPVAK